MRLILQRLRDAARFLRGRLYSPLHKDERGIAAVEFALILPLMLMIYMGLVELSRGMRVSQKLDLVAHSLADLTAQMLPGQSVLTAAPCTSTGQACMAEADINVVFSAAATLLAPFPLNNIQMTITELQITGTPTAAPTSWTAKANWTVARNGGQVRGCAALTGLDNAAPVSWTTIPTSYIQITNGISPTAPNALIVADVVYQYSPGLNFQLFNWKSAPTWTMQRTSYAQVRNTYIPNHILYYMTSGNNCKGTP